MNCPVCDRSLAPTLSICPSCGAMMYDTVREDLQAKVTSGRLAPRVEAKAEPLPQTMPGAVAQRVTEVAPQNVMRKPPPPVKKNETSDLVSSKTSPTLVGFQSKNAALPDWRIQLQNAVQQRKGGHAAPVTLSTLDNGTHYPTNGGAALKVEIVQRPEAQPTPEISDPRVASAMRRIAESRDTFLEADKKAVAPKPAPAKSYPFGVVPSIGRTATAAAPPRINALPKPTLVRASPVVVAGKRDTNKLPPINFRPEMVSETVEPDSESTVSQTLPSEFTEIKRIRIRAEHTQTEDVDADDTQTDEIEDLALFSTRFGAGLFDLIIAGFASLIILSPIAFTRGEWLTTAGLLTFTGVCAIILFFYMTVCLGFYGKTMGMRLFSLELVDAVENEYPTLHQAAVSSSVFILSLVFGGAGFLTVFFNEEKRAAHDLLSGTILVREF